MAGALAVVAGERLPAASAVASFRGHWEVSFSRFFALPSRPPACPVLAPLRDCDRRRLAPSCGTWLSSSSTASLQLHSGPAAIVTVCLSGKLLARATFLEAFTSFLTRHSCKFRFFSSPLLMNFVEEHFVSKLQFFRPQLSYMSEFPAMASRVVLVSYRDCGNEIQKFALRFSTTYETDSFTHSLKEILKDATEIELQNTHVASQISSHSEFTSYSPYRVQEERDTISCIGIQNPEYLSILENESQQFSPDKEIAYDRDAENGLASFPPSFTSFLTSCCADHKQATTQSTIPEVVELKSQIMKYMGDSEFQEMLLRVDTVINEIGM